MQALTITEETQQVVIEGGAEPRFIGFSGNRHVPKMNVSKEADAEFMRLLKKEYPKRYASLFKNMIRISSQVEVGSKKRPLVRRATTPAMLAALQKARSARKGSKTQS
jgi:hypothetical protein